MLCGRWADSTKRIRAGSSNWASGKPQQFQSHGMTGDANADARQAGGDEIGNQIRLRQHHRQRPRPQLTGKSLSHRRQMSHDLRKLLNVGHVDDQRIKFWPLLGFEDPRHCPGFRGVGTESVDRLRGERDQAPGFEQFGCQRKLIEVGENRRQVGLSLTFVGECRWQGVDLIPTRCVSEGSSLKTRQLLSLTDVSGCENPLNQHPAGAVSEMKCGMKQRRRESISDFSPTTCISCGQEPQDARIEAKPRRFCSSQIHCFQQLTNREITDDRPAVGVIRDVIAMNFKKTKMRFSNHWCTQMALIAL